MNGLRPCRFACFCFSFAISHQGYGIHFRSPPGLQWNTCNLLQYSCKHRRRERVRKPGGFHHLSGWDHILQKWPGMIFNRYLLYHKDHPKNTDAYVEFWEEKESGTWVCNCCLFLFFFGILNLWIPWMFPCLAHTWTEVCLTSTSCPTSKIAPGRISRVSEIWRKQLAEALSEQQFWYTSMLIAPTHSFYSGLISHFLDLDHLFSYSISLNWITISSLCWFESFEPTTCCKQGILTFQAEKLKTFLQPMIALFKYP